jgi:hypothetical protein
MNCDWLDGWFRHCWPNLIVHRIGLRLQLGGIEKCVLGSKAVSVASIAMKKLTIQARTWDNL